MLTHCFLKEFQGGLLITGLRDKAFERLALMINRPPQVLPLIVALHEHLVQMPAPPAGFHALNPSLSYLGSEHRTEPMPPVSHRFRTDIDAALVEQILHVPKG